MAYNKKTKTSTKVDEIKEEIINEKPILAEDIKGEPIVPEKKVFQQSDGVKCRSVVSGHLYVEGLKTGIIYSFMDYGDESELEYRDLVAAVRSKDKSVYEPRFVVDDPDFLAEFPALDDFYSKRFTTKDIRTILNMSDAEMKDAIDKLPSGAKESLKTLAAKLVTAGELDSMKKIKTLDEIFGTSLGLIGELITD